MRDLDTKVVGLRDRTVPLPNGVEPDVVRKLEAILEEAKRGDIIAFAAGIVRRNLEIGTKSSSPSGHRHLLVASCAYLMHDLCEESSSD